MKILSAVFVILCMPLVASAAATVHVSPQAAWGESERVTDNIKKECDLPAFQAEAVLKYLKEKSITSAFAEKDEIPTAGYYLQLRLVDALSSGNAFIGHRKSVSVSAKLFLNGAEVAKTVKSRDSMGGFGAGFKGSCVVLRRCCETLGKDIAEWLTAEIAKKQ